MHKPNSSTIKALPWAELRQLSKYEMLSKGNHSKLSTSIFSSFSKAVAYSIEKQTNKFTTSTTD